MSFERRARGYEQLIGALVERRHQLNMTQMQVDQRIGWPDGTLNKYEQQGLDGKKYAKTLGAASLPLVLAALDVELVVVERSRHVLRVEPARSFGPGDPEWGALVSRAMGTGAGPVEVTERDTEGHAGTSDGFAVGCMTTGEVAEYLGVSSRTVKRWMHHGHLNAVKVGGVRRITRSSVEAMLQAGRKWSDGGARVESPPLVPADGEGGL